MRWMTWRGISGEQCVCGPTLGEVMVVCAFKWAFIGRYTAGAYPFYGAYHFKWIVMMAVMVRGATYRPRHVIHANTHFEPSFVELDGIL